MKSELLKYKHHLIILLALIVANYITVPLWDYISVQKQEISLLKKHATKTERLLLNADSFSQALAEVQSDLQAVTPYMFNDSTESRFKLSAQQKLEELISNSKCELQRISWKNATPVGAGITKWYIEARFKGNPSCMLKVTRGLGSIKPLVRIDDFSFTARRINGQVRNKINANLELMVLYKPASLSTVQVQAISSEG